MDIFYITLDDAGLRAMSGGAIQSAPSFLETPILNDIAKDAAVFEAAFAPGLSCFTARCGLVYGVNPLEHGLIANPGGSLDHVNTAPGVSGALSLPEALPSHHFIIGGKVHFGDEDEGFNTASEMLSGGGFDAVASYWSQGSSADLDTIRETMGRDAENAYRDRLLGETLVDEVTLCPSDQPVAVWAMTHALHSPANIIPGEEEATLAQFGHLGGLDSPWLRTAYAMKIVEERIIAPVLAALRARGRGFVLVIDSDQGPAAASNPAYASIRHTIADGCGFKLSTGTANLLVPLIVYREGADGRAIRPAQQRIAAPVVTLDTFATLCDLVGEPIPAGITSESYLDLLDYEGVGVPEFWTAGRAERYFWATMQRPHGLARSVDQDIPPLLMLDPEPRDYAPRGVLVYDAWDRSDPRIYAVGDWNYRRDLYYGRRIDPVEAADMLDALHAEAAMWPLNREGAL